MVNFVIAGSHTNFRDRHENQTRGYRRGCMESNLRYPIMRLFLPHFRACESQQPRYPISQKGETIPREKRFISLLGVEFEDSAALAEWNALHNGDSADGIARAESELPNSSRLGRGPGHEARPCPRPRHSPTSLTEISSSPRTRFHFPIICISTDLTPSLQQLGVLRWCLLRPERARFEANGIPTIKPTMRLLCPLALQHSTPQNYSK
ncbi:hypothetical protein DBV15_11477 [Temnothorax longispinosus]|uniref:Uncharacterized protein n=1 Tax=Temnothorax longispinosus TaxID=300112 RepID=A0A4S2KA92_9HYME|nr:hypothetical protein DBV15_11477 [Temnothorax longispinosus]